MLERDEFTQRPTLKLGRYRHYKGGEYEVLMLACDEISHDWLVIYRALYDTGDMPDVWCRTFDDFTQTVQLNGENIPRFEKIDE